MKALYAGSFDPFTIGHMDIARRSLMMFDELVIGIGINECKKCESSVEERIKIIKKYFRDDERVFVTSFQGLTVDFARSINAGVLVRGVRNGTEFAKEKELADINLDILGMPTVMIPAKPALSFVSSSMVRELRNNGFDISEFLPQ